MEQPLDDRSLHEAVTALAGRDEDLAAIVARYGMPPLWPRTPGFPTLILMILEQQVSLASARAAYNRLEAALGDVTPAAFLQLDDGALRAIGFSRQKSGYGRHLAQAMVEGRFDPSALAVLGDDEVRQTLTQLKGIGPWTAEVYLLMVLRRADAWPVQDIALASAAQEVKRLPRRPTSEELRHLGEAWRPWRAVAARLLWHHYLSRP